MSMPSPAGRPAPALRAEFLLRMSAEFEAPLILGATPLGTRRILIFKSGAFAGPRLKGAILPGGGDWVLVGQDGAARLDIRLVLRADDGGLIHARSRGIFDAAPGIRERILAGEDVDPSRYYFRTLLEFETGAEPYRWLNRLVAAGVGKRTRAGMETDAFALAQPASARRGRAEPVPFRRTAGLGRALPSWRPRSILGPLALPPPAGAVRAPCGPRRSCGCPAPRSSGWAPRYCRT